MHCIFLVELHQLALLQAGLVCRLGKKKPQLCLMYYFYLHVDHVMLKMFHESEVMSRVGEGKPCLRHTDFKMSIV